MRIDPTIKLAMQGVVVFATTLASLSYLFLAGSLHKSNAGLLTEEQRAVVEYHCWCLRRFILACLALTVVVYAL